MGEQEGGNNNVSIDSQSAEEWLSHAQELVPMAIEKAREVKGFQVRWKMIISKLQQIPPRLSDLSTHPFFSKNTLCKEQLQSVSNTLSESIQLSELCLKGKYEGKLRVQSDLDSLSGKLDLSLKDLGSLIKTPEILSSSLAESEGEFDSHVRELLARIQIGRLESKIKALDGVLEAMRKDEKTVLGLIGRSNIAALVQLITASSSNMVREKAVLVICSIAESGSCENWLVSEGVLPPLIRLLESGSAVGREKAAISLQKLSMSPETARWIVGHGGVGPLIEICWSLVERCYPDTGPKAFSTKTYSSSLSTDGTGDLVGHAASACTLKNLSVVPEVRQNLADEGVIKVMINLLDCGVLLGSNEYAAECLQNLTSSNENFRRSVVLEGGIRSLLGYLDGPLPQESAVGALRNLIPQCPVDVLVSLGLIPCLVHVLKSGSLGAQVTAASIVCRLCSSSGDMKKLVGEKGCIPPLVKMLEASTNSAREVAAQAISILVSFSTNRREVKRDEKSVPNLVQLLDPCPQNTAKKYAVSCLGSLSSSKECKKLMVSYGAIGYLKKLSEADVSGAKKLLERLERGNSRVFFGRKWGRNEVS